MTRAGGRSAARSAPVYLDANVFIAAFEQPGPRQEAARELLRLVETRRIRAVTSELTLAEVLVMPLRSGDRVLIGVYRDILVSAANFVVAAVSRVVMEEAAAVRARFRALRLPDAIHVATAVEARCRAFVSGDQGIQLPAAIAAIDLRPDAVARVTSPTS